MLGDDPVGWPGREERGGESVSLQESRTKRTEVGNWE